MTDKRKYNVGLVQMRMGAEPEANFSAAEGRERRLPAGTLPDAVFLPA